MLFDLRGRGRRRTVQVIYLSLAILMGGGLVLFGIGGDVQGGLVDAITGGGGGGDDNDVLEDDVEKAEERVRANRQDAGAWAELAEAKANLAGQSEGYDESTQTFTGESRSVALSAIAAWNQHVKLAGDRPDDGVARVIVRMYTNLNQADKAFQTWDQVVDAKEKPLSSDYSFLAELGYLSGDPALQRRADLAAQRTVDAAKEEGKSKDRIAELKSGLDQLKAEVAQQQIQDAQQGAGGAQPQP
jgi:hypothetical protein